MERSRTLWRAGPVGALILASSLTTVAQAQDETGIGATLGVRQTLRYSDNPDLRVIGNDAFFSRTDLSFDLRSQTRADLFQMSASTGVDVRADGDFETAVQDPQLDVSYSRTSRDSELGFSLGYRRTDISTLVESDLGEILFAGIDSGNAPSLLIVDDGTRTSLSFGVSAAFGKTAPFGGTLDVRASQIGYTDTTDPDLSDSTGFSVNAGLRFDLSRTISARTEARYSSTNFEGEGIDRERLSLGVGVDLAVNPVLTTSVDLGYDRVELDGGPVTDPTDQSYEGATLGVSAALARPNGSYTARLSTDIGNNGRQTSASLSRNLETKTGALEFTFGLSDTGTGAINPLISAAYTGALPNAQYSLSIRQSIASQANGDQALNSLVGLGYQQELTRLLGLQANLQVGDTRGLDGDIEDVRRIDASLSLSRPLTRDWDLVGGYSFTRATADDSADRTSNTVFIGVDRTFDWRF